MEAKIGQGYQKEREVLLEEEKEAKRLEMLSRLRAQAKLEDERLAQVKAHREEEKKQAASAAASQSASASTAADSQTGAQIAAKATASDPARQSFSQDFMKDMDQDILAKNKMPALPDLATSKLSAVSYQKKGPQQFEEIINEPAASAQPAKISAPESNRESLQERKMRLEAHRDSMRKKKADEEAKLKTVEEEKHRDEGDIFRNT